ncbi:MAG TPA: serine hydrolase domain-containing protein [Myxococcota bacterium]|nr:serine hydrolase domain-containing protein [Myxococcota bacterium]
MQVQGRYEPRFEGVRRAFEENFATGGEVGAAVSVVVEGRTVVDLWGGHADARATRPWERDTLVNVYSTTKGMTALCAHQLVEEGQLDLDAPVARYWPEFAAADKGDIPVRWLLSHRAGLPAVRRLLPGDALFDWDAMTSALAAEAPWWEPGTQHGYHAVTFGWLVGEVVRRITGKSLGRTFHERIAGPLDADFWIGLPDAEHERVARLGAPPIAPPAPGGGEPSLMEIILQEPEGMTARAFVNPPSVMTSANTPEWRRAEIPGANGHGNARAIARIYGAVANGTAPSLAPETIERARTERSRGGDAVLRISTRIAEGFMLPQPGIEGASFGPNERSFGHPGAGGSLGFADPEAKLGFGYVMNHMGPHILIDPRAARLVDATYAALGAS